MSRVKFNVNSEYAYLQNFKVLQSTCADEPPLRNQTPPRDSNHEPPISNALLFPSIQMSLPVTKS